MTILPRAATAPELTKIRSDNQSSRLYLTVHTPATVYSARLAALPSSNDNVVSVTYNSGVGTHTDILVDQTMYVGTSAGAYDLGMVRIRSLTGLGATSGTFTIGQTSEIVWSANAYLTVVDEFALWPRWPVVNGATTLMDTDVAYTNQHSHCFSFPIFPRYAVKWLTGASVNVVRDGSQSWALNNTINAYTWSAPGSSALSGGSTDTATITYNAVSPTAGYRVGLTIGNTDSVSFAGYGRVFVLADEDDAITQFAVNNFRGSYADGGWSADIICYAQADRATIRDRALAIIHRRDWYGDTEGSIGYVADDENIELVGWIAGESIVWSEEGSDSTVTFTIYGPQWWLQHLTMPTVGLKNTNVTPTNWRKFQGLTAKSATWHILMWRTTAPRMMDCFAIENGYAALQLQSGGAQNVWSQLSNILNDFLIAKPCCDAYGRLFMQIEQNCLSAADRSSIPSVMTVTTGDWSNSINFERRVVPDVAIVDLSGELYVSAGNTYTTLYSLSPGRTFGYRGGQPFTRNKLSVISQSQLNTLTGAVYGWQNNPYPRWRFKFPSNLHLIDLAPYQYLTISIATGNTPRGFTETNLRVIPREILRNYKDGFLVTEVGIEANAPIATSVTGDVPSVPPVIPVDPPPPPPPPPPPVPIIPPSQANEVWWFVQGHLLYSDDFDFGDNDNQPTWNDVTPSFSPFEHANGFDAFYDGSGYFLHCDNDNVRYTTTPKNPASWTTVIATGALRMQVHGLYLCIDNGSEQGRVWTSGAWIQGGYTATAGIYRAYYPDTCTVFVSNSGFYDTYRLKTWAGTNLGPNFVISVFEGGVFNRITKAPSGPLVGVSEDGGIGGGYGYALLNLETGAVIQTITGMGGALSRNIFYPTTSEGSGSYYYVINYVTGEGYISSNGTSMTLMDTWLGGRMRDANLGGGGAIVWAVNGPSGYRFNTAIRVYAGRTLATAHSRDGNIWSIIGNNDIEMRNVVLIYPPNP